MEAQPGAMVQADDAVGTAQRAKAQEFKNTGNDKFNKNNFKGAIVDYQKGLLHEPNNPDLHANLSAAYLHLEKYIEAEEHALFAIYLKPTFFKGYMRAAKADHGKGMTRLALKRLAQGLDAVTDPNGLKELNRLKNQYTAYLSLQSNSERELEFDSDTYQSEDEEDEEDEGLSTDHYSSDDQSPPPPPQVIAVPSDPAVDNAANGEPEDKEEIEVDQPTEPAKTDEEKTDKPEPPEGVEPRAEVIQDKSEKDTPYDTSENKPDNPLERLRVLAQSSEMKKNIADFKENLKAGGQAYLAGNYRKAADNYKAAYERIGLRYKDFETEPRQCNVIRYASYVTMINLDTYDDIVKGVQGLKDMTKFGHDFPAIYVQIARAYYKLNRFKTALEPLEKVQDIIGNCPIFPTFIWPGTDKIIEETTPSGLKNSIKELNQLCRMPHKPTATCRFDNCLKTSSHILPLELIYSTDPDFIGYVRMICEEKCHIEFHVPCWKSYKESVCGIGKVNDKDFVGRRCLTTDCINGEGEPSIIITIEIINPDGQVKSVNKPDAKACLEQKAAEKKAKKKRSKLEDKENKEKISKPKKTMEKKVKTKQKKQIQAAQEDALDEEDNESQKANIVVDPVKAMQIRKESFQELRKINYGRDEINNWDPRYCFYGCSEESIKASNNQYLDHSNDSTEVRDAKEFLFSYFVALLKDQGPLKLSEIEEHWRESAEGYCDITVVLPDLTNMCDLLMESTRFCQLEDRLCLAEQLEETHRVLRDDLAEYVTFVMTGTNAGSCDTDSVPDHDNMEDVVSGSGEESEYESSSDSDESEDEGGDAETEEGDNVIPPSPPQIWAESFKPQNDGKFSLEDIMKEMARMKNILQKSSGAGETSPTTSENDSGKDQPEESVSNETFETAYGSSANTTAEEIKMSGVSGSPGSDSGDDDHRGTAANDNVDSDATVAPSSDDPEVGVEADQLQLVNELSEQRNFENSDCDKGSQSEVVTEERHIQTAPETKDRLSQTKESDLYKELKKKVQELSGQLTAANKENARLGKELVNEKAIQKAQHETISRLQQENQINFEARKALEEQKLELSRREKEFKRKEEELTTTLNNMKDSYSTALQENGQLKAEKRSLVKDSADVKRALTTALTSVKEIETNRKSLEFKMKNRVQKALQAQLNLIKVCWETQLNLHKKRCVEKITEMHNWFSISPGEVESLPSYHTIQHNIMQWMEMGKLLQGIESNFQAEYSEIEKKIKEGNEMEDLKPEMLPLMPKEPALPPLENIHKEISEKHLKTIAELTQLVASQQLQIEKSKEQTDQLTQMLISTFGSGQVAPPRVQQPVTPSFGGLALQYSYPGPPFPAATVPPGPPVSQDAGLLGSSSKLPDVNTLFQESTKMFSSPTPASSMLSPTLKEEAKSQTPPLNAPFSFLPPAPMPPVVMPPPHAPVPPPGPALSMPPPPMGVAQNLMKTSSSSVHTDQKKDIKAPEQRAVTPKLEQKVGSSRESTPGPVAAPITPTPEKAKKKKKKAGEAAAAEARIAAVASLEASVTSTSAAAVSEAARDDGNGWSTVLPKSAMAKQHTQPIAPMTECKLKNKKKLLDKLQCRFPTIPLKELDDIVKQVRENNNGSLSGLPFDEIEARVERIITKKHLQKNSTMGLVKFSEAAWVPVKPQEIKSWNNMQHEECTICLEPMGNERTKVDCNHEFHTKCLRKWLKEKSVCPLCNKFTTMPDEFPAL